MAQQIDNPAGRELAGLLAESNVFTGFHDGDLSVLSRYATYRHYGTGETILVEGEHRPMLGVIIHGRVSILKENEGETPTTVATLGRGKVLGELSLIDGLPFSATACVLEPCQLLVFEQASLNALSQTYPRIYTRILDCLTRQVSSRLRHTTDALAAHLFHASALTGALNESLQEAKAHSGFITDMGHSMRTPLNAIVGYSELLQDDIDTGDVEAAREDVGQIREAARTLSRLVSDIMDLSRIESGRIRLQLETVGVRYLVEELVTAIGPLAANRGNRLEVKCPEDIGVMKADELQLRQMLYNLLENACEHTRDGVITIEVEAGSQEDEDQVEFRIRDTGVGMPPEQAATIFERFTSADGTARSRYSSTGLGLAISHSLCTMFGGSISASSERNVGSTFTVSLPRIPAVASD